MPAEFGGNFLPHMKNVPKGTKLHLNEIGLTKNEFCKRQIRLRQPPIPWNICYFSTFCNARVKLCTHDQDLRIRKFCIREQKYFFTLRSHGF